MVGIYLAGRCSICLRGREGQVGLSLTDPMRGGGDLTPTIVIPRRTSHAVRSQTSRVMIVQQHLWSLDVVRSTPLAVAVRTISSQAYLRNAERTFHCTFPRP